MDGDAIWTAQKLVTGHSELHLGHTARSGGKSGAVRISICLSEAKKDVVRKSVWLLLVNSLPKHNRCTSPSCILERRSKECIHDKYSFAPHS